jgi:predicted esterase
MDDVLARMTRRRFVAMGAAAIATLPRGCASNGAPEPEAAASSGRLTTRPGIPGEPLGPGRHALGLATGRDGWIHVPASARADHPAPLLVLLHGASQRASEWDPAQALADELGLVLVVPDSRDFTWDVVRGGFGADVAFIDAALSHAFTRCQIDPARVGMGGFSDGASYALSLGLTNGDLVTHVLAFSPGFMDPGEPRGRPHIRITHGTRDAILPIDSTSRRIVPRLKAAGYDVIYEEFAGGHTVTPEIAGRSFRWFAAGGG